MNELIILLKFIQKKYEQVSKKWLKNDKYYSLNMKTSQVHNIYHDKNLLLYVFSYRDFINDITININNDIQTLNLKNTVNTRVKALNSIQDKIEKYENKEEKGRIPIKKCLNDIFVCVELLESHRTACVELLCRYAHFAAEPELV